MTNTLTRNIFDELGVTTEDQQLDTVMSLGFSSDSPAPSDLHINARPMRLPYKDDRINDPAIRQWMEERRLGVGASEIAVLFGLSPWSTVKELWSEKVNGCAYEPGSELFHWGHTMEPVIAAEFARRENVEVADPPLAIMIGEKPYYRASLDRVVIEDGVPVAALELKNLNESRHAEYRTAGPSIGYLLQLQYQMMVTELDYGFLAVLFGGQKFGAWRVLASPSIQREIRSRVDEFWHYVETKTEPPDTIGTKTIGSAADGSTLILTDPAWETKLEKIEDLRCQKSKIEKEEKILKAQIKECMGDFQSAHAGQMLASVSTSTRKSLDTSRLKEEQPELVSQYQKDSEVRYIRIRRRT